MSYAEALDPQAVAAHDLARQLPDDLWSSVLDGLAPHVSSGGTCIDIGIGSGAVGGRLVERGVDVLGVDCNPSMLQALRASHPHLPAVIGDATSLPFASEVADLVVMACLLHLVYDWRAALEEAVRVAAPGAVLAVNVGQSALAGRTGTSRVFLEALKTRIELPPMPGPSSTAEVVEALESLGCTALPALQAEGHAPRTIRDHIFRLQWNPFGWPPGVPQWALAEAAAVTIEWALGQFGSVDDPNDTPVAVGFAMFRSPA